ncbi:MAG: DUF2231 domain-containing protein [Candidatus Omnitrophota bacterium]
MFELLQPLHPKMVHFPVALFITALIFETLSWLMRKHFFHQCALCLYVTAALITPLVVKTGLWETERLNLHHPLLDQHQRYALWTMWFSLMSLPVLWFFYQHQKRLLRVLFVVCLFTASGLVIMTGDRGGKMVYEYGVGVDR